MPSERGRVGDDVLRRCRLVVGDVVDGARPRSVDRGDERRSDVVDVDAVEDLARLDDAPGSAVAKVVQGVAPRPVDAGEAEDLHRLAARGAAIEPGALRRDAPA